MLLISNQHAFPTAHSARAGAAGPASFAPSTFGQAGKLVRMGRIFGEDGRCLVLPLDHGTQLGRVPGLEDPLGALASFIDAGCDGFLLGPGVLRRSAPLFARRDAPARLLTADLYWADAAGSGHEAAVAAELAASLGADAIKVFMPWDVGAADRSRTASLIARLIEGAEPLGMPVMVEPIVLEAEPGPEAVEIATHGCRVAVELGADIIKLAHPGDLDLLGALAAESGVPLVLLGGPGASAPDELVEMVAEAVKAGASGIVIGRKVWQRPLPEAVELLARLRGAVHD